MTISDGHARGHSDDDLSDGQEEATSTADTAREGFACEGVRHEGKGFAARFNTDPRGGFRDVWVVSQGLSYSAHAYVEVFYLGTHQPMRHTITAVQVLVDADSFFMHGCDRPGRVLIKSDTGRDFAASYSVEGGMVRNVTIVSHGYGFLTRPRLLIDDGNCRCGSYITAVRIVYKGKGLTTLGRLDVFGEEGGAGFQATFSTINGSLAELAVLTRGSGYVKASTLRWQLTCFNEITSVNEICRGGELLEFEVGLCWGWRVSGSVAIIGCFMTMTSAHVQRDLTVIQETQRNLCIKTLMYLFRFRVNEVGLFVHVQIA